MPIDADHPYQDTLRAMERAHELARSFIEGLPDRPVSRVQSPAQMAAALDEPLPAEPSDPAEALAEWLICAEPGIVGTPGPRFFGFVNGGVTPAALGGDWLTSALDQSGGLWIISPAAAQTELVVHRWLKQLFGLPTSWAGILTTGGTMSNLVGLAAARQWASNQLGFDAAVDGLAGNPPIHVVSSTGIHASAVKSLGTLGLGRSSVTMLPAPDGTIDLDRLRAHLAHLTGPVILIGNAGEVNTGQFDDLRALADLRDQHPYGAWLHVDGAFGLFAAASPRHRHLVAGIERADSVASDAHKWLNVPYDCGFAFVRDERALTGAFASRSAYLTRSEGFDADDRSVESSRRFRALAAWCALKAFGRTGYQDLVERCIDNARALATWIDMQPGVELMNAARLRTHPFNIVCFRFTDPKLSDDAQDALNRRAVDAIQRDGRTFVSGTSWDGRAAIRASFVNWATTPDDVRVLQQAIEDVGHQLRG
jgi:glutamate/tyrosine decarboxylase-like PLP-dependent enzyme